MRAQRTLAFVGLVGLVAAGCVGDSPQTTPVPDASPSDTGGTGGLLFNFTTKQSRLVVTTERAPAWLPDSLGVSSDGRLLLLTQNDLFSSSILLMKDFR